jgi:hypothetical protein
MKIQEIMVTLALKEGQAPYDTTADPAALKKELVGLGYEVQSVVSEVGNE